MHGLQKTTYFVRFKNLKAFNLAVFGKQSSKLISIPDSLITRLLKVKNFSTSDYFTSSIGYNLVTENHIEFLVPFYSYFRVKVTSLVVF